jgi:hypothetical protein
MAAHAARTARRRDNIQSARKPGHNFAGIALLAREALL